MDALSGNYPHDRATLQQLLGYPKNQDAIFHAFRIGNLEACAIYIDGMVNMGHISDFILRAARYASADALPKDSEALLRYLAECVLEIPQANVEQKYEKILSSILSGMTFLLVQGANQGLLLETRGFDKRGINQTINESVVMGAQEGFVENLRTNITLLHRYCQDRHLTTEFHQVGKAISAKVAMLYLDGVADEGILNTVRARLQNVRANCVQGIGQLQQYIEDSPMSLLPQMLETERPDRAVSCLLDGQVVLLMDNSPYALVAPVTLFHLIHASDDSFMRWQYGSFLRVIRLFGIFLSLFLPGLYVALCLFHSHLIPMALLSSIAEARANVPFPVVIEVFIMEISFYLINEAGTRMPSQLGSALGIVGGLILGQAAVAANIISPIMIIIAAVSGLGNYAIPNYGISVGATLYRIAFILAGALAGLYGILLAAFVLCCRLCSMRSFGVPYMAPVAPWRPHNPDILLRMPLKLQKIPMFFARRESWLQKGRRMP